LELCRLENSLSLPDGNTGANDVVNAESRQPDFFCSQLVALGLQRAGLLPHYPPSEHYLPATFGDRSLRLLKGAVLGPPEVLKRRIAK
jgi:hypothetical protein